MPRFEGSSIFFTPRGTKVIEINCPVARFYYIM